jgi:hypothetical protein
MVVPHVSSLDLRYDPADKRIAERWAYFTAIQQSILAVCHAIICAITRILINIYKEVCAGLSSHGGEDIGANLQNSVVIKLFLYKYSNNDLDVSKR